MPNPSTLAEMEAELVAAQAKEIERLKGEQDKHDDDHQAYQNMLNDAEANIAMRDREISNLLNIIKEKNELIERLRKADMERIKDKYIRMNEIFKREHHTIGEFVSAVCRIDNEADACQFADEYLAWLTEHRAGFEPINVMRSNIGWCFGEGMSQERIQMWSKVCEASHPFFGRSLPSTDEALQMGRNFARREK